MKSSSIRTFISFLLSTFLASFCLTSIAADASQTPDFDIWAASTQRATPEEFIQMVKALDCSSSPKHCLHVALTENYAFAKACVAAMPARIKAAQEDTAKFSKQVDDVLSQWTELNASPFKAQITSLSTPWAKSVRQEAEKYLMRIPVGKVAIECTRIAFIMDNEDMTRWTDTLASTKNHEAFRSAAETKTANGNATSKMP